VIVTDASALVTMLVYADGQGRRARKLLARDPEWAAPEHWKAEVFSALRRLTLAGTISEPIARRALAQLSQLTVDHVTLDALLQRMWDLRATVSGYDAAYVALAEQRDLTLVTADAPLARAATSFCRVELVR
jgi:predicted nucleic acid-binding protein